MMIDSANGAVLNDILNLIEDRKIDDDWMPALVELLISFFTDDSQKTRSLVLSCFKQINQDLNRKAIEVIASAIDPAKDASLEVEDDDAVDEDGVDEDSGEDGEGENGEEKMDEDESEDDDESDDDSEDEGIDNTADNDAEMEELKRKLAIAMGEKDPNDDREDESDEDESEDDFTDEQMFAMDNAISGAFKSMGKGKKKADQKIELQKRNFKLRVLDLVEIFMKRNSKSPNQFLFVKPLLKCARAKTESPLSQKAGKMVSKVMPSEKVSILRVESSVKKSTKP